MSRVPPGVQTREHWPAVAGGARGPRGAVELSCDVAVVGSGAGGAVAAAELAEGGHDVILLEEGGYHTTDEFTVHPSTMVRMLYRDGGLVLALGLPPVLYAEGRCVGGSTTINGGMTWRTPERILERWEREHGLAGATGQDMERIFDRVERFTSAAPQDPGTVGRDNELLREGAGRLGWRVIDNIRNQKHCAGANNCAFGCPTGAKQSTLVSYVPRALRFGARLHADCRVDRLLRRGARVVGLRGRVIGPRGEPGQRFVVRCPAVVLAAGAVYTPTLLQRSGVRSPSGQVGRNLSLHPNAKVVAIFDEQVDGYRGAHQVYQLREFIDRGMLAAAVNLPPAVLAMTLPHYGHDLGELMDLYSHMVPAATMFEDTSRGRVVALPAGRPLVFYQLSDRDAQLVLQGTAMLAEAMFAAGARRVLLPFAGFHALESADELTRLRQTTLAKSGFELSSVHLMGTAAMGSDPRRHVCDPWGAVYGSEGLYVADASLFPTPLGVNPMETIMALATRVAGRMLDHR